MTMRIKISELPEFDAAEFFEDKRAIAEYLSAVTKMNDPALLTAALDDIARVRHNSNRQGRAYQLGGDA